MRKTFGPEVEGGRLRTGPRGSGTGDPFGSFRVRCPLTGQLLTVVASDGDDWAELGLPPPAWEHVSASTPRRTPTWEEMAWVKNLFFLEEEAVVQLHPPRSEYVNDHSHCLHLWRPVGVELPRPPLLCV